MAPPWKKQPATALVADPVAPEEEDEESTLDRVRAALVDTAAGPFLGPAFRIGGKAAVATAEELQKEAPPPNPEAFAMAAERARDVLPSGDDLTLDALIRRINDINPVSAFAKEVASWTADESDLARDVYDTLTPGQPFLREEELAKVPVEEQDTVRRRQAPIWQRLNDQATELGRGIVDVPVQAARGAVHMGQDVVAGEPGRAVERAAGTGAVIGGEMLRSLGRTGRGDIRGREIEAFLDITGGAEGLAGGVAAAKASRGLSAWKRAKAIGAGAALGGEPVTDALIEVAENVSRRTPLLSAQFPGQSKAMFNDARFEGSARGARDVELTEPLLPGAVDDARRELADALITQGEELAPVHREALRRTRAAQAYIDLVGDSDEAMTVSSAVERWMEGRGIGSRGEAAELVQGDLALADDLVDFMQQTSRLEGIRGRQLSELADLERERVRLRDEAARVTERRRLMRDKADDTLEKRRAMEAAARSRGLYRHQRRAERGLERAEAGYDSALRKLESDDLRAQDALDAGVTARRQLRKANPATAPVTRGVEPNNPFARGVPRRELEAIWTEATEMLGDSRDFRAVGKGPRTVGQAKKARAEGATTIRHPDALAALLDPLNTYLGRKGDARFVDPKAAWVAASRKASSLDELEDVAALIREVPGFEAFAIDASPTLVERRVRARVAMEEEAGALQGVGAKTREQASRRLPWVSYRAGKIRGRAGAQARMAQRQLRAAERDLTRAGKAKRGPISAEERQAARAEGRAYARRGALGKADRLERDIFRRLRRVERKIAHREKRLVGKARVKEGPLQDPVRRALQQVADIDGSGGHRLMLRMADGSDEVLNSTRAATLDLANRTNLRRAYDEGRLRFEGPEAQFANEVVLPVIVRLNELTKESVQYGLIGADTARVLGTNYLRAYYDQSKRTRYHIARAKEELAEEGARVAQLVAEGNMTQAQARSAMSKTLTKATEHIPKARPHIGKQFGLTGHFDLGSLKRASSKFYRSREAQMLMGRAPANRVEESLTRFFVERNRMLSMHKLYRRLRDGGYTLSPSKVPIKELGETTIGMWGFAKEKVVTAKVGEKLYMKMPNNRKRWGDLSDQWVEKDLAMRLTEADKLEAKTWARILSAWKKNKVINNISSQIHVAIGNMVNQVLDGGSPTDLAKGQLLVAGRKGWEYQAFRDAGLTDGQLLQQELDIARRYTVKGKEAVDLLIEEAQLMTGRTDKLGAVVQYARGGTGLAEVAEAGASMYEAITDTVFGFGGATRRLFEAQELGSRMAILKRFIEREAKRLKKPVEEVASDPTVLRKARAHVLSIQLDYGDLPRWAQLIRGSGMMPFISYPWKATGMFLRQGTRRAPAGVALLASEEALYDLAPLEEKDRRDLAPSYRQGYTVPLTEDLDIYVRYMTPFALFPISEGAGAGARDEAASVYALPSHMRAPFEALTNEDHFYKRPISYKDDPAAISLAKRVAHVASAWGPGYLTVAANKMVPAMLGWRDRRGEELSTSQAWLHLFAARVYKTEPPQALLQASRDLDRDLASIDRRQEDDARRGKLTPAARRDYDLRRQRIIQMYIRAAEGRNR